MSGFHDKLGDDHAAGWVDRPVDASRSGEGAGGEPGARAGGDEGPRPRVLIESPDGAEAHALWRLMRHEGYDVSWCPGPAAGDADACPLVTTDHCALVDDADVVLCTLSVNDDGTRQVLDAHRHHEPGKPVIVSVPQPAADRHPEALEGNRIVRAPLSGPAVIRAVEEAVRTKP